MDIYQCFYRPLLQHFPVLLYLQFKERTPSFLFALTQLVKLRHVAHIGHLQMNAKPTALNSLPGELYNGFTKANISDLLILLHITWVVKQNLLLFLENTKTP